jgi:hypothetical protein
MRLPCSSSSSEARLLIVGDTPLFNQTISCLLSNRTSASWSIRQTTYDRFPALLSPRLLHDNDLAVLELWRRYPGGLRAEGLAVAETLARLQLRALVVSPLAVALNPPVAGYWDLATEVSLPDRIEALLRSDQLPAQVLPEEIKQTLAAFLQAPDGHSHSWPRNIDVR